MLSVNLLIIHTHRHAHSHACTDCLGTAGMCIKRWGEPKSEEWLCPGGGWGGLSDRNLSGWASEHFLAARGRLQFKLFSSIIGSQTLLHASPG